MSSRPKPGARPSVLLPIALAVGAVILLINLASAGHGGGVTPGHVIRVSCPKGEISTYVFDGQHSYYKCSK